jgi:gluconolactonase
LRGPSPRPIADGPGSLVQFSGGFIEKGKLVAIEALNSRLEQLIDVNQEPEQIASGCVFTEGPIWNPRERTLIFSDVRTGIMRRWSEQGGVEVFRDASNSGVANGNTYDRLGNLLTCEHAGRRISRTTPDGQIETVVDRFEGKRLNSPNDLIVLPNGDIIFTDPTYGLRQPDGSIAGQEYDFAGVFRFTPATGTLEVLADDFDAPNGLAMTDDLSKLYVCDTRQQHIRVFDVDSEGGLSNGRVFVEAKHDGREGRPDGMKLDSQGNVYLAANSPEGIWVFSAEGELLGFIGVGESPANLAWGGDDWRTMFVTAQTSVYRLQMKVPGQPVRLG